MNNGLAHYVVVHWFTLVHSFQTISYSCYTRNSLKKGDQRDQGTTTLTTPNKKWVLNFIDVIGLIYCLLVFI